MARYSRGRGASRPRATARRSSGGYSRSRGRSTRTASRGRRSSYASPRTTTQRLEIVMVPPNPVARPELIGLKTAPQPIKRKL